MMEKYRSALAPCMVALSFASMGSPAWSADPVAGRTLYITTNGAPLGCAAAACHGTVVSQNKNKILRGANAPAIIQAAINNNDGGMGFLSAYVNATDIANIAAYIANPNATVTAPVIALSTTSVAFGPQAMTTTSGASTVTVSNTGSAALNISAITLAGANSGDFTRSGTCAAGGSVAAGSSCTVNVTFAPTALGARSASIALTHNAPGSPGNVSLSGTGTVAPVPILGFTATSIGFAPQSINTTSATQFVTITNSGGAALNFSSLGISGTNAGDFSRSGTCAVGTPVAPSGACTIGVAFRPIAVGASRAAQIDIVSNALNAPHSVGLSGSSTLLSVPDARLSDSLLVFGNQVVGVAAPVRVLTLSNAGSAALALSGVVVSGADFAYSSACGASIAPGASCAITLTFTPIGVDARSGSIAISTNSVGSPHSAALSGVGFPSGTLPAVTLTPPALSFGAQPVGAAMAAQITTIRNDGPVPLTITALNLSGSNAADFNVGGTCAINVPIAPAATCNISIGFTPIAAGSRVAVLSLASNASGSSSVSLAGEGSAQAESPSGGSVSPTLSSSPGGSAPAASNVGAGGCAIGASDQPDPMLLLLALIAAYRLWFVRSRERWFVRPRHRGPHQ